LFDDSQYISADDEKIPEQSRETVRKNERKEILSIDNEEDKPALERIVWFFEDGSFREYSPAKR
jgi:acetyl-CoA carboxylase carboxyltransferase component